MPKYFLFENKQLNFVVEIKNLNRFRYLTQKHTIK